jgi:hypothetical protein
MGTGARQQDRDAVTDARNRELLAAGNPRAALHCARRALEAEAGALRRTDPARAALLDASLAGSLSAIAATLATSQPRRPPGYTGGAPTAADLLAAYAGARAENARPARPPSPREGRLT